jgi:NDP-sugar pyrophosphorylase family protein
VAGKEKTRIGQAVILCAGLGTRLRPFTDNSPKPMLPLLGVPMIEWNIKRFLEFGIKRFLINLHYLPDVIRDYVGDGRQWGATVSYHYEPQILGTAGGVKGFEDQLEDEFFVIYGDIFSQIDYHAMEVAWRERGNAVGMQRVRQTENYADADVVELDATGRVLAVHAKPHTAIYPKAYRMAGIFRSAGI